VLRTLLAVTLLAAPASAGGLVVEGASPREVGRAGTGTVGDDGGGALLANPAAMARRDTTRVQLGAAVVDDNVDFHPNLADTPTARDQAGSSLMPLVAAEFSIGDWIVGAGAMTSAVSERALASPGDFPASQLGNRFEYRYAGVASSLRRDTLAIGVAHRIGEDVAFGVSASASRVSISEDRRIWAGFTGREAIGDPNHDVDLALTADDPFSPSVVAGVLVAPTDTSIELGASIAWARAAHARGTVAAAGTPGAVSTELLSSSAAITLREPVTARVGARWLAKRWIAEVGGDLWMMPDTDESWSLGGVRVIDATGVSADLSSLPSRLAPRTQGAVRAAIDVELVAGLLWVTGGYAFTSSGTATNQLSPTFGDLGGHTLALGLETSAAGLTISLGWARQWSLARTTTATDWLHDNAFGTGDGPVATGSYDGSRDLVALAIDAEL
jgi:hypothetical protein